MPQAEWNRSPGIWSKIWARFFPLAAALAVVGGGLVLLEKYGLEQAPGPSHTNAAPYVQNRMPMDNRPQTIPHYESPQPPGYAAQPPGTASAPGYSGSPSTTDIQKCRKDNTVVYSDRGCEDMRLAYSTIRGSAPSGVHFASPGELAQQQAAAPAAVATIPAPVQPAPAYDCKLLIAERDSLDAMARQPQTAQMQDWIRERRRAVTDAMYHGHC